MQLHTLGGFRAAGVTGSKVVKAFPDFFQKSKTEGGRGEAK